jgi:hypothetical protein
MPFVELKQKAVSEREFGAADACVATARGDHPEGRHGERTDGSLEGYSSLIDSDRVSP